MNRYRMIAYYKDFRTSERVAQLAVVIEEDLRSAVRAVQDRLAPKALGRRMLAIEVEECHEVSTGVVHMDKPHIPYSWPLDNRHMTSRRAHVIPVTIMPAAASSMQSLDATRGEPGSRDPQGRPSAGGPTSGAG